MMILGPVLVAGWLTGWVLLWIVPRLRTPELIVATDVAVVVPARNEETSLPELLASLGRQTLQPEQIVVVDDQSTDRTAELARSFAGVTVVAGEPLPEGWAGKPWACHQAMQRIEAADVVFIDADVTLADGGLAAIVAARRAEGGLLSVQPFHRMTASYERCSAIFNVVAMMGVGAASLVRSRDAAAAFGPVLACSVADYRRAGGHAAVRDAVVEDIVLARRFSAAGLGVTAKGGRGLVSFRMYPDGLAQLIEGWSKNIATGAVYVAWWRSLLTVFWFTTTLMAVQQLFYVLDDPVMSVIPYAMFAAQLAVMLRQLGNFGAASALLYPVLCLFFLGVFVRSAWLTLVRREVRWRGRTIRR